MIEFEAIKCVAFKFFLSVLNFVDGVHVDIQFLCFFVTFVNDGVVGIKYLEKKFLDRLTSC